MAAIPSDSKPSPSPQSIRAASDHAQLRAAAKAGYEGQAAQSVPEPVKRREQRRAEREREAYKRHYLGTPQGPR